MPVVCQPKYGAWHIAAYYRFEPPVSDLAADLANWCALGTRTRRNKYVELCTALPG